MILTNYRDKHIKFTIKNKSKNILIDVISRLDNNHREYLSSYSKEDREFIKTFLEDVDYVFDIFLHKNVRDIRLIKISNIEARRFIMTLAITLEERTYDIGKENDSQNLYGFYKNI